MPALATLVSLGFPGPFIFPSNEISRRHVCMATTFGCPMWAMQLCWFRSQASTS
jgi:hypothetical protein